MASIWDTLFSQEDYRKAAPQGGYADLYQGGLLARNRDREPMSVEAMRASQDFIPGIGDALALGEAYDAASRGELVAAGLLGTAAAIGLVPGAGDLVARPIMAAGRKAADLADRIEVDPNAFGSMGGNVRLRPAGEVKPSAAEMRRQANIDRFGYDPNEAPAPSPNTGLLSDYVGEHRAPMRDGNAPAFNLAGDIYPDDIYSSNAVQYYGTGDQSLDRDTMGLLQSLRDKPDADVTIYRAVPKGVDDLNAGDWVTVNKQYAQDHGERALGGDFDIVERKVKASEIFTNGDSIQEFGYDPLPSSPQGIKAFHGSPHDFDRFSMDAIGTGEGAQAYGHGLYFAENEAVADSYKQSIRRNSDELKRIAEREGGLSGDAAEMLSYQFSMDDFHGKGFDKWLEGLQKSLNDGMLPLRSKEAAEQIINRSVEASDAVRAMKNPGSMYEVNINANPDDFLDWDAPLSEQPEKVRRAFSQAQAGDDPLLRELLDGSPEAMQSSGLLLNSKGSQAYNTLASSASRSAKRPDQLASQELRDVGIPGIKYKDGMSRGAEGGTQNFVVFDDKLISIVKKYGIAGAAAMLGVSTLDVKQAMAEGSQQQGLIAPPPAQPTQQPKGLLQ